MNVLPESCDSTSYLNMIDTVKNGNKVRTSSES
jgi:hypothetical protein